MNDNCFNGRRQARGSSGRGRPGSRGGWRGRGGESSNWRHTAQSRLVNLQTGLSSSTGNLNVQSRGTVARASTESMNSLRDPAEFYGGSYFEAKLQATRGTPRRSTNRKDDNPTHKGKFRYGYRALKNLLPRPPEEIIMDFLGKEAALKEFMESKLEPDVIVLLTHVFATACSSKFTANMAEVLMLLLDDNYLRQLLQYLLQLPLQEEHEKRRNKVFWEKVEEFWSNLWFLFSQLLERIPTIAVDVLPKHVSTAVDTLLNFEAQQGISISDETFVKFNELQVKLVEAREVKEGEGKRRRGDAFDDENPPDDFREMSIYPAPEELNTADYRMDVHYHLGISLFERMTKNNFPCQTLNVQHRMRPEIATLVAPSIYPNLQNHHSVLNFEEIKGVDKSLYFITHQHAEQESADKSKENSHEATFLLLLAQYLVLNGYAAEKITLLATYSGQLFRLLKERRKYLQLRELNIKVLDNYQGEENDIILLSLVRNNSEGKIGFLQLENQVCVALSRARMGMYVMGNMDLLCEKSKIWPKIREVFERQNALGDFLLLRCQRHPDQETEVKCGNDFKKVLEGGCMKLCGTLLECGHNCDRLCHMVAHNQLPCKQPCTKIICEFDHICPKKCFEECEKCMVPKHAVLPCGHEHYIPCHMSTEDVKCPTEIDAILPCGHATRKRCYLDINVVPCGVPCDVRVEPCGHSCLRNCHINNDPNHEEYKCMKYCERQNKYCTLPDNTDHKCRKRCYERCTPCDLKVTKTRTVCTHTHKVNCSEDVDKLECMRKCTKTLPCDHKCKRNCNEACGGCKEMVEKVNEACGHMVKCACSVTPTRSLCRGKCQLLLKCGHKCTKACRENCDSVKCLELVTKSNVTCPQGHNLTVPCHLSNETQMSNKLLSYCKEECTAKLECGHRCKGTCGSCAQGRVHADCAEKCNKILVCGHECAVPCRNMCQPCTIHCPYRCGHSRCTRKCGFSCTPCQERCQRRCPHVQCRKKCNEICEVGPCVEPCPKKLKCGHNCIGFCGDECPPLCRTCDAEIVTECFFGTEDDEDARFVYLPNCKHVIESSGLEQWIETCLADESSKEISVLRCPKCKEFITCLQRYDEYLKLSLKDVEAVKNKFNGNPKANNILLKTLLADVQRLGPHMENLGATNLYAELKLTLEKSKNKLNQQELQSYAMKIQILQQLCDTSRTKALTKKEAKEIVQEHVKFLLGYLHERNGLVNNQKRGDMEWELKRFTRVFQLATIVEKSVNYSVHPEYKKCRDLVFSFLRYSDETDAKLKRELAELSEKSKSGLNITDAERRQILQAMDMSVGHWYKCPKGHVYAIGDSGSATVTSTCPECGAQIGGTCKTLLSSNAVATEMDGARVGAYDASIGRYNIQDYQRMFGGP